MARKRKSRKLKKTNSKTKVCTIVEKEEKVQITTIEHVEIKQPIIAPSGKTFYPCQYCSKIFPRQMTCKTHMDKCFGRNIDLIKNEIKINEENVNNNIPTVKSKAVNEPIVAPNGKLFYPCQYCSKIFPREVTCKTHMEKCFSKIKSQNSPLSGTNLNYNDKIQVRDISSEINISQNVTIKPTTTNSQHLQSHDDMEDEVIQKETPKYDLSIYDYDEDTTDEVPKNKDTQCKLCPFIAKNAIELLRHKRNLHTFPRKILPPNELEKYFDYPDRNFCPICEKPIKTRNLRSIFVKHLLVHTTGLTFECRICKKKFRRSDHLRCHEKRHVITYAEVLAMQETVYEDDQKIHPVYKIWSSHQIDRIPSNNKSQIKIVIKLFATLNLFC